MKWCRVQNENMLVASHLKPYSVSDNSECIDFNNGLLLCSQHDRLIDSGLISFDESGSMCISSQLSDADKEKLNLDLNRKLDLDDDRKKYMQWHRDNIFKD